MHMLRAKRGFAQSGDCPMQSSDPWLVVQTMDWPRDPGIVCAQNINQDNPEIARALSIAVICTDISDGQRMISTTCVCSTKIAL